jgi:ribulose-phosphate 3-epimerase
MKKKILIAPSILAADFSDLKSEIKKAELGGADMIHVDVMDGHFVPNITIGPLVVRDIKRITKLPLDVHLMIENPSKYIDEFRKAGSDIITIHAEAEKHIGFLLSRIKSFGIKAGVSLRPGSSISLIKGYLKKTDMVLIMTVEPGFGGQAFMEEMLPKIKKLKEIYDGDIQVDGGIDRNTGTSVFKAKSIKKAIKDLRE